MENKWYNKTWIVVVASILFAPVGIYAIYKNTNFSSSTKKVLYVIVGIFFIFVVGNGNKNREAEQSQETVIVDPKFDRLLDEKEHPEKYLKITKHSVSEGGFGTIGILNCTFKNDASIGYKDIVISVTYYGESGTEINSNEETLLKIIKPNSTLKLKDYNLGFTSPQFSKYNVKVISASLNI